MKTAFGFIGLAFNTRKIKCQQESTVYVIIKKDQPDMKLFIQKESLVSFGKGRDLLKSQKE